MSDARQLAVLAAVDRDGRLLLHGRADEDGGPEVWGLPEGSVVAGTDVDRVADDLARRLGVPTEGLLDLGTHRCRPLDRGEPVRYALRVAPVPDARELTARPPTGPSEPAGGPRAEPAGGPRAQAMLPRDTGSLALTPLGAHALTVLRRDPSYVEGHGHPAPQRFGSVILVDRRGRVLLQERDEHARISPERWGLVGGHLEPGEEPRAGAARELTEETGIDLPGSTLVRVGVVPVYHPVNDAVDEMHLFAAAVDLDDGDVECHEGRQIVFVDPEVVRDLSLTDGAALALGPFLSSRLYASMTP